MPGQGRLHLFPGRALEQPPRVHGQQPAGDPGEGEEAEDETGHVVPEAPALIGRPAPVSRAPQTHDPDVEPGGGQEHARRGRPDHHLGPQLGVAAQAMRIEPVGYGPQPGPEPALPIGRLHHLARTRGHIDHRPGRIRERHPVDRPTRAGALDRPLVLVDQPRRLGGATHPLPRGIGRRLSRGCLGPGALDRRRGREIDHPPAAVVVETQQRSSCQHFDAEVRKGGLAQAGLGARRVQLQRLEPPQPLGRGHRGIAAVDHDEAREAPQRHHQPDDDAEIAMHDQHGPHQARPPR